VQVKQHYHNYIEGKTIRRRGRVAEQLHAAEATTNLFLVYNVTVNGQEADYLDLIEKNVS